MPQTAGTHRHGGVRLEGKSSQVQTDIRPITPTTTEFEIHYGHCTRCYRHVQARDLKQISVATGAVGGVQIGPNTIAITAHLGVPFPHFPVPLQKRSRRRRRHRDALACGCCFSLSTGADVPQPRKEWTRETHTAVPPQE